MTSEWEISLTAYVKRFIEKPELGFGAYANLASALSAGSVGGVTEEFRRLVEEVALSVRPAPVILVTAGSREEAMRPVSPLMGALRRTQPEETFTYSWKKEGGEGFACPYRHDPIVLLPEKSRREVLSKAAPAKELSYPLALESKRLCPDCQTRYKKALARAEGVWERLAEEVVVHPAPEPPENADLETQVRHTNRGAGVFEVENGSGLLRITRTVRGGDSAPPVTALLFVPVTEKQLKDWMVEPGVAEAVDNCCYRIGVNT